MLLEVRQKYLPLLRLEHLLLVLMLLLLLLLLMLLLQPKSLYSLIRQLLTQ
jgi:hypothetical protein